MPFSPISEMGVDAPGIVQPIPRLQTASRLCYYATEIEPGSDLFASHVERQTRFGRLRIERLSLVPLIVFFRLVRPDGERWPEKSAPDRTHPE